MRVPLSWLRDFASFDLDPRELGRVFDELGMVVDAIERVGEGLDEVVVGRVIEVAAIPQADRIRRVVVDVGQAEPVTVVCGAFNFEEGATIAFAPVGITLPGIDFVLERRKMRGVESNGMICSARELGLGDDHEGIMLLDDSLAPGQPLTGALGIEPDVVYDLDIETNRPDANSIAGVARDAAAKLGLPFRLPSPVINEGSTRVEDLASISVECPDLCPRFTVRAIQNVVIGPSAEWVQRRLTLAGMRPINNVVDASNYVMLELGQPTHPYDRDRVPGHGFIVRRAQPAEVLETLDGVERALGIGGEDCLICDAEDTPIGIAGIMGGASSEISADTTTVLLEAANFDAMAIARTSKRLGLRTEASARFERGVDPEGIDLATARFFELIGSGDLAEGMLDDRSGVQPPPHITLRASRVNALLGTELADEDLPPYLEPIGFSIRLVERGVFEVVPPTFRPDVFIEVHVIEEVARHLGYENVPKTVPLSPLVGRLTNHQRDRRLARQILVGAGLDEAMSSSLIGPGDHERAGIEGQFILAANAMIKEESILRQSLRPGLLRSIAFNVARRSPDIAFFEIGNVWLRRDEKSELPAERESLAVALAGSDVDASSAVGVWTVLTAAFRLAATRLQPSSAPGLHPTRTATAYVDGQPIGTVGEVDPMVVAAWDIPGRVAWIELDLTALLEGNRHPDEERPISRFPSSDIDLAFVVPDSVPAGDVAETLRGAGGDLLVDVGLFDVYRGAGIADGNRSLALRLRFCALDHTLTDDEVGEIRAICIAAVETTHGARLRG